MSSVLLFAVHLSDGVLSPTASILGFVGAAVLVSIDLWRIHDEEIPRIGVLTGAFFVASQIHLPVGVSSVHLLLNGLLGVVLGTRAAPAIAVGLTLQALLFAHGGLSALGINICVYTIPALLGGILFRLAMPTRRVPTFVLGVLLGLVTGIATLALCVLALVVGGMRDWGLLPWAIVAANLPVVGVEAVGMGIVVSYLERAKPEWLGIDAPQSSSGNTSSNGISH